MPRKRQIGYVRKDLMWASCKTPARMVGTEPDPPEDAKNGLFSAMEGRPPCRPREFCKRHISGGFKLEGQWVSQLCVLAL